MVTKLVDMAVLDEDEKTHTTTLRVVKKEVKGVSAKFLNRSSRPAGQAFSDLLLPESIRFRPGEIKRLEVSEGLVAAHRAAPDQTIGAFQLTDRKERPGVQIEEAVEEIEEVKVLTTGSDEPVTLAQPKTKAPSDFLPDLPDDDDDELPKLPRGKVKA